MDRAELGWLMFGELDQVAFEAWLDQQPDAADIGREIGGVYLNKKSKAAKPAKKKLIASLVGGRVTLQEWHGSDSSVHRSR